MDTAGGLLGTGPSMLFVVVFGTLYPLVEGGAGAIFAHTRTGKRPAESADEAVESHAE